MIRPLLSVRPQDETRPRPLARAATEADLPAIVRLHSRWLPYFFLVTSRPAFLRAYYSLAFRVCEGSVFVTEREGNLTGFAVGLTDPARFYQGMANEKLRWLLAAAPCLAKDPIRLPGFLFDLSRSARLKQQYDYVWEVTACELTSVVVDREFRRQGHGTALVRALADAARSHEMSQLRVNIDPNDDRTSLFCQRLGFVPRRTFAGLDGRWMIEYVLPLQGNGKAR